MKDIIKKIIIAVLVVAVIGGGAAFVLNSDEPEVPGQSTSGAPVSDTQSQSQSGNSEVVNGTTAAQTPSGDVQGSTNSQNPVVDPSQSQQGTDPSQSQQGVQSSQPQQSADPSQSQQGVQPSQPQQSENPSQSQQSGTDVQPQQVYKVDRYQEIFKSGKFLMKVNDPDLGAVTMAMNGNKMFVEASMEGLTLKMLYDGDKPDSENPERGTWYIVIDKIKKYSPMPSDMIGDMNIEELTSNFTSSDEDRVYTVSMETINGEQLYCESCPDSNGNTTKYYFRGDVLVRSDSVSPSGEVSTTEFQEINQNVDESLFIIPSGYAKWDISWLMNMMG